MAPNQDDLVSPDFLALGLGGTNMMSMLWSIAMGRRAVGVEMRGDPFLGVHWNIREDFYHQLGLIDHMMLERYGEERIPRRGNGQIFRLAECFYSAQTTAGDIVADEIIDGFDSDQHIVGTIHHVEFIDDRWRDGMPNRVITVLDPPVPPQQPSPEKIRTSMAEVLDGPSTFQAEAASILKLLRRYLELLEQQDRDTGNPLRVQLFTNHRVIAVAGDGFIPGPDGRVQIRIEALREFDFKGEFVRVREPGSEAVDLGVPELFMIAEGFNSADAKRLGFEQHDVTVDHGDGQGPLVAQADFLAGLIEVLVGGRLRRRISSEFDKDGREYWVRQIAVGHENDPEVGWVLVQVPDFKTFDPIEAGLIPPETDLRSPEYFASYQQLIYNYYVRQVSDILEIPTQELKKVQMIYGPILFSLVERLGADALVAPNGVAAGDSFGNGHFLTSGGAMTGMVGHSSRVLQYWRSRAAGVTPSVAIRTLADSIKEDTCAWLEVSAKEYSQAVPINFGAERIDQISKASGIDVSARANTIEAARRQRHTLLPLDPSNWRRLFVRNGRVLSALPDIDDGHPLLRPEHAATLIGVLNALRDSALPLESVAQPDKADLEQTVIGPRPAVLPHESAQSKSIPDHADLERTAIRPRTDVVAQMDTQSGSVPDKADIERTMVAGKLSIGVVRPTQAKTYAFLEIQDGEQDAKRIAIPADQVIIGRSDSERGISPTIDLSPFDAKHTVSREHARIRAEKDDWYVEDLRSLNFTRWRTRLIPPFQPQQLHDGDALRFGEVEATFRLLGASELPSAFSPS